MAFGGESPVYVDAYIPLQFPVEDKVMLELESICSVNSYDVLLSIVLSTETCMSACTPCRPKRAPLLCE
jgi:hypothetical protein